MESFIRADQYHFIEKQTASLVNSHSSTADHAVTSAMKAITQEKVMDAFEELTEEQKEIVAQVEHIKDEGDALFFLSRLKQYITPFPKMTEHQIKSFFPKVKKLQLPDLHEIPWHTLTYLGWTVLSSKRKYLITKHHGEWVGLQGDFTPSQKPGICSICHESENVGMFTLTHHNRTTDEVITRGNYICQNSEQCNHNMKDQAPLHHFVARLLAN